MQSLVCYTISFFGFFFSLIFLLFYSGDDKGALKPASSLQLSLLIATISSVFFFIAVITDVNRTLRSEAESMATTPPKPLHKDSFGHWVENKKETPHNYILLGDIEVNYELDARGDEHDFIHTTPSTMNDDDEPKTAVFSCCVSTVELLINPSKRKRRHKIRRNSSASEQGHSETSSAMSIGSEEESHSSGEESGSENEAPAIHGRPFAAAHV